MNFQDIYEIFKRIKYDLITRGKYFQIVTGCREAVVNKTKAILFFITHLQRPFQLRFRCWYGPRKLFD